MGNPLNALSVRKMVLAISFAIIFLAAFNMPSVLDLANNLVLYLPLYVLISIPDVVLYGEEENMHEIKFIHLKHKMREFLTQLGITILGYTLMVLAISGAYILISGEGFRQGVTLGVITINALTSAMMVGLVTLLTAVLTRNKSLSYTVGFAYWIYWNLNSGSASPMNPFTFIADPNEWSSTIGVQVALLALLTVAIAYLNSKTPYFGKEKLNKLKLKMPSSWRPTAKAS